MSEICKANPCCGNPVNCTVPLPQHTSGISHLNAARPLSRAEHDVISERRRQVEAEGWTPEHDDLNVDGEIAAAGACYALSGGDWTNKLITPLTVIWPWNVRWWKPKDRRRDLVRAGALIIAEIERLDRASANNGSA